MSKHTPGPWEIDEDGTIFHRPDPLTKYCIADMQSGLDANACLIAAAPELLEALVEILGPLNVCSDNQNVADDVCLPVDMTMGELRKARAAIAKAEGRS